MPENKKPDLKDLVNKVAITAEEHAEILQSPEAMTKAFIDLLSVSVYTCWKEVDKWVTERAQTVVPLQFAAMVIEITNPKLHGREPEFLKNMLAAKGKNPNADFLHLIQDALNAMKGEPDAG